MARGSRMGTSAVIICKNTGYKGRVGIYEVMPISEEMQRIILAEGSALDIQQEAIETACVTCARQAWPRCASA